MRRLLVLLALSSVACTATSTTGGLASYVKPVSEGGQPVAPQRRDEDLHVTVTLEASGEFETLDSQQCRRTSGPFAIEAAATGSVAADGTYESAFDASVASESAKSVECGALENVKLTSLTGIRVDATLPATEANCAAFCQARADDRCATDANREQCTTNIRANCVTDCGSRKRIVGTGTATASAVDAANEEMDSNGNTSATVDLVFTEME